MAEPFRLLLNERVVRDAAQHLARHARPFDALAFEQRACAGLDALTMKARAMQIADALEATLPADFDTAAGAIERALAPMGDTPTGPDSLPAPCGAGLQGWVLWPVGEFIARRGLEQPARALAALRQLTQRFTAEFAIRPFVLQHPGVTFETLQGWLDDPSPHVRRLVSEGTRPRLPWGLQLKALVADPGPTLPLLRALQDDGSSYVRRSVANHLNDIAKDHPATLVAWLAEHLPGAPRERRALLRHASRSLIKAGDPAVMRAWGLGGALRGEVAFAVSPDRLVLGEALTLTAAVTSTARRSQALAIDYVVHHVKAAGHRSPKVFKGWTCELPPGGRLLLRKQHPLRRITTRRYHTGLHTVVLQVNGRPVAEAGFWLDVPAEAA